jgi:hypothetical protein
LAQPLWDELIERLEASSNHPERIQDRVALSMMLLLGVRCSKNAPPYKATVGAPHCVADPRSGILSCPVE